MQLRLRRYEGEPCLVYAREARVGRSGKSSEIRLIPAACERSTGCGLPSHELPNPANAFRLDSRSGLRPVETGELRIERGDQGLGEARPVGPRGIHPSKLAFAGNVTPIRTPLPPTF